MKKPCLLISPPGELNIFPRGIMEIATFLNEKGCPARVLPLDHYITNDYTIDGYGYMKRDFDKKEVTRILKDAISDTNPQMIGVSNSYTKDFNNCIEIIKLCKRIAPQAITVIGGQHATFCDRESLQAPELDMVVRGEGEGPMLDLMSAITTKKDVYQTAGISFKTNGTIYRNPSGPLLDVTKIPAADFGLLPQDYVKNTKIHGILTRGCAYHCKYCAEKKFWGGPRSYGLNKLIEEMAVLQKDYNTQMTGLEESMLDMRSRKFFALCQKIQKNRIQLPEQFYLTTRVDTVSQEGVESLRNTGIKIVCIGIENFSEHVLKMMNKKHNNGSIMNGCRTLKEKDVWVNSYWLIGHPGDNKEEADFTFSKFKEFFERGLLQSGYAFIFVPYPGTEYFNNPGEYGIQLLSADWRKWRRWTNEPISCLDNFSGTEIVAAFEKAQKLLDTYKTLNVHLYKTMNH